MLKHAVDRHEGEDVKAVEFRMKVLKFHRSSFERQVSEAVAIQSIRIGNNLLNSKSEFNRSAVPRLALKLGAKSIAEDRKKEAEEDEQDRTLLDRIKTLRRLAGKRHGGGRGRPNANPAPKRMKMNEENEYSEVRNTSLEPINPNMGEKRKPANENETPENANPQAKRRKKGFQMDIRLFSIPSNTLNTLCNNVEDNRVNQKFNYKTNEIDCRILPPQTRTTAQSDSDASEYRVSRVGNAVQCSRPTTTHKMRVGSAGLEQGLATGCQDAASTITTQSVQIVEDVTCEASNVKNGLGTAFLIQTVTGELADYELENGLGTALLTQTVTGGLAAYEIENGLGTALLTQTMAGELADIAVMNGLGTAPLTRKVTGDLADKVIVNDSVTPLTKMSCPRVWQPVGKMETILTPTREPPW